MRPSDLDRYNLPEQCRLDMTESDLSRGEQLLEEDFVKKNPEWVKVRANIIQSQTPPQFRTRH